MGSTGAYSLELATAQRVLSKSTIESGVPAAHDRTAPVQMTSDASSKRRRLPSSRQPPTLSTFSDATAARHTPSSPPTNRHPNSSSSSIRSAHQDRTGAPATASRAAAASLRASSARRQMPTVPPVKVDIPYHHAAAASAGAGSSLHIHTMPMSRDVQTGGGGTWYHPASAGPETAEASSPRQMFHFPRMGSEHSLHGYGPYTSSQSLLRHQRNDLSTLSLSSRISLPSRITTLEVYDLVYGESPNGEAPTPEAIDRLYDANAVYENPLITASSRQIIGDINALSRQLRELDVPRPTAMLRTLFRLDADTHSQSAPWFQALRVWSEIEDICDSESFDGHRTSIIEHTINILFLPGLHSEGRWTWSDALNADGDGASDSSHVSAATAVPASSRPTLTLPGLKRLPLPSPLHLRLRVYTRLTFNEQGRIARHRDICDVRDMLALFPGASTAQWLASHAAGFGVAWAVRGARRLVGSWRREEKDVYVQANGSASTNASISSGVNALGLQLDASGGGGVG